MCRGYYVWGNVSVFAQAKGERAKVVNYSCQNPKGSGPSHEWNRGCWIIAYGPLNNIRGAEGGGAAVANSSPELGQSL